MAADTPHADVVTGHHVVYNVGDIVPVPSSAGRPRPSACRARTARSPSALVDGRGVAPLLGSGAPRRPDARRPRSTSWPRWASRRAASSGAGVCARRPTRRRRPASCGFACACPSRAKREVADFIDVVTSAARARSVDDLVGRDIANVDVTHLVGIRPARCDLRPVDFGSSAKSQT